MGSYVVINKLAEKLDVSIDHVRPIVDDLMNQVVTGHIFNAISSCILACLLGGLCYFFYTKDREAAHTPSKKGDFPVFGLGCLLCGSGALLFVANCLDSIHDAIAPLTALLGL